MKKLLMMVAAVLLACSSDANAQWGLRSFGYGSHYGPGMYAADTRVPYFALYPPVYYSYPVPRPYGYSPFAYPGWTPTPHVESMEPQTIINPYIQGEPVKPVGPKSSNGVLTTPRPTSHKQASVQKPTTIRPLRIINSYVAAGIAGTAP